MVRHGAFIKRNSRISKNVEQVIRTSSAQISKKKINNPLYSPRANSEEESFLCEIDDVS